MYAPLHLRRPVPFGNAFRPDSCARILKSARVFRSVRFLHGVGFVNRVRFVVRGGLLSLAVCSMTARADAWPEVKVPPDAKMQTIASDMLLNGKPSRLARFELRSNDADVLAFYRTEFGAKRVVENRVKGDPVIATRQGDYFVTVQLHALDSRTVQGTVMTTLLTATPATSTVLIDTRKVFPPDTQVVSSVQTDDAGKRSLLVAGVNRNSVGANRDHVVDALLQRGFRLTKEDAPRDAHEASSVSLQLSSPVEEATVTISNAGAHRGVVINRVREGK